MIINLDAKKAIQKTVTKAAAPAVTAHNAVSPAVTPHDVPKVVKAAHKAGAVKGGKKIAPKKGGSAKKARGGAHAKGGAKKVTKK